MPPAKKARAKVVVKAARKAPRTAPPPRERAPVAKPRVEPERPLIGDSRVRRVAGAATDTELRMHETLVSGTPEGRQPSRTATSCTESRVVSPSKPGNWNSLGWGSMTLLRSRSGRWGITGRKRGS